MRAEEGFACVIYRKVNRPGRQVADHRRPEPAIKAAEPVIVPDVANDVCVSYTTYELHLVRWM